MTLTSGDAYAGLCAAHRKGDYLAALKLSRALLSAIEAGRVRWLAPGAIANVVEIEADARRRLEPETEGGSDGL